MTRNRKPSDAPTSIKAQGADNGELLNERGYANLSREALFKLFEGNPNALRKFDSVFQLKEGEETIPISSRSEPKEEE